VKTHVRVLVIGGGVVGVSTLYHLAGAAMDGAELFSNPSR